MQGGHSNIDLVMGFRAISFGEAVQWIAERFWVPSVKPGRPIGRRSGDSVTPYRVGVNGSEFEFLVRSGMFGQLSLAESNILVVLANFRDPDSGLTRMSYAAIGRYAGVGSSATISRSLKRLARLHTIQVHWGPRIGITRECNTYRVTLDDPKFCKACNEIFQESRAEISRERAYRAELLQARQRLSPRQLNTRTGAGDSSAVPRPPASREQQEQPATCEGLNLSSMGEVISNKALHAMNRETDFNARKRLLEKQAKEIQAKYGVHPCD
jgi:hypothetical protein